MFPSKFWKLRNILYIRDLKVGSILEKNHGIWKRLENIGKLMEIDGNCGK